MKKPLIGITAGEIINGRFSWAPTVHGQAYTYTESIIQAGGVPVILPLTQNSEAIIQMCDGIDGLLLSGGNDINPELYGETPYEQLAELSYGRDNTERQMLDCALKADKPVLAICRGMQFINVFFGGSLYQDIPTDLPDALDHESSTKAQSLEHRAHPLTIEKGSKLHRVLGTNQVEANSHHHQAVKQLGKGLRISARSSDGVVEGLETTDSHFIIGIQAHPESLGKVLPEWRKLFEAFIERAG